MASKTKYILASDSDNESIDTDSDTDYEGDEDISDVEDIIFTDNDEESDEEDGQVQHEEAEDDVEAAENYTGRSGMKWSSTEPDTSSYTHNVL